MGQAEEQEPEVAAVMQGPGALTARVQFLGHEQDACAEEQGEDGHELLVGEDVAQRPDPAVCPGQVAVDGRVGIGGCGHGEALDIHDENAQQGEAAQDVDGDDSLRRAGGGRRGLGRYRGHTGSFEE